MRDRRCEKEEEEIAKALTGTWREEHLFVLAQSPAFYDFYTQQVELCDAEIERTYSTIRPDWKPPEERSSQPAKKRVSYSKNAPREAHVRQHLQRIAGVDLVAVDGISTSLAQTILAEIGTDMTKFPDEQNFCSWLGLAPHNDISGRKVLSSRTLRTKDRAGQAFRQAAAALTQADYRQWFQWFLSSIQSRQSGIEGRGHHHNDLQ